jgi:integrase
VFAHLDGVTLLVCRLLYGSGMRLLECLGMRVKDLDFQRNEITVRDGKGRKDRVTLLPATCAPALNDHLAGVRQLHLNDLRNGLGRAALPDALSRKYTNADREWGWQFVFPASSHYTDSRTGIGIGITCTRPSHKSRWPGRSGSPALPSRRRRTPCVTPSPRS